MAILITGANRGIGLALAQEALARGIEVIGTTRSEPAPLAIRWERLDVRNPADHADLARRLGATRIDVLVCNAGITPPGPTGLDHGYPPEAWAEAFAVHVTGAFLSVQALLPALRAARGKVALIASQMGSQARAPGGSLIYRASKAAEINLGRNLAADLRRDRIAVGIYHPGWVKTDMGGRGADIAADVAAKGLMDRFAALSLDRTGCFETWDGRDHPL